MAVELIETGLATPNPYNHLMLNPALCPYLRGQLNAAERESLTDQWAEAMRGYAEYLEQEQRQKTEIAATLTLLELPNLFALLDHVQRASDAEATIDLATLLYSLLQAFGKPRLFERVAQARDAADAALGQMWNHARFEAQRTQLEQQLRDGRLREGLAGAQELLRRARQADEAAYPGADYDLAMGCNLLGQVLTAAGGSQQALPLLDEALKRFESIDERGVYAAKGMIAVCHTRRGHGLLALGRLDEAAAATEESIRRGEELGAERDIAVGKSQLGTIRLMQRRYEEALQAHEEARERFARLDEPGSVAMCWHQTGTVYQEVGRPEAAEDAYRQSLTIKVRLGNGSGQGRTLVNLGNLYHDILGRLEEAVAFYRQAADKFVELGDEANEGVVRSNLGNALRQLRRFDQARQEIHRAIGCKTPFGHASEPWTTWNILYGIETADGNPVAAAEAKRNAVECYLTYRRDGGENHNPDGRICLDVTQALLASEPAAAATFLQQISAKSDLAAWLRPLVQALQAIVAGSRDRTLADDPDLYYTMVAEILFLLETLEQAHPTRP